MKMIQMLNSWKFFRRDTLSPLVDDEEIEFPTWFYAGIDGSAGFSAMKSIQLTSEMNSWIFSLDRFRAEEFPQWFYYDKEVTIMSWLEEYQPESSEDVYRTWLTRKENDALGIED